MSSSFNININCSDCGHSYSIIDKKHNVLNKQTIITYKCSKCKSPNVVLDYNIINTTEKQTIIDKFMSCFSGQHESSYKFSHDTKTMPFLQDYQDNYILH